MRNYKKHLIQSESTIRQALEQLDFLAKDAILFVVSKEGKLIGSLTDGDVRRGLLKGAGIDDSVDVICNKEPKFVRKGEQNIEKIVEFRERNFLVIPVLNQDNKIVDVINFGEVNSYLPVDAVIMAGGKGERLRPLTEKLPKPLLKVGDKAIIEYTIDRLQLFGIENVWVSVNYLAEKIEKYLGDGNDRNVRIRYIRENLPLGTIGAVSKIPSFEHDFVLITNSDLLTNINLEHFFLNFINQEADFSVVTIPYRVSVPYAVLETSNGHVVDFKEKPSYTYYSNGGIYLMKTSLIDLIPKNSFYNATDFLEKLIRTGKKVISFPMEGYWLDIGKPEDFDKARNDVSRIDFD